MRKFIMISKESNVIILWFILYVSSTFKWVYLLYFYINQILDFSALSSAWRFFCSDARHWLNNNSSLFSFAYLPTNAFSYSHASSSILLTFYAHSMYQTSAYPLIHSSMLPWILILEHWITSAKALWYCRYWNRK